MSRPLALDLFCGAAGGWSLGLARAGISTVAACEIDPWRQAVFGASHPGTKLYGDIRDLTATRLLADLGYLPDIVVGSPPCQDASAANTKGRGVDGARTGLFSEAVRLVDEIRPAWACFENSPRLRTRGADWILGELEALDYAAWPFVVGARDVGANHVRGRVWIIAADAARGDLTAGTAIAGATGQGGQEPRRANGGNGADAERVELREQPGRRGRPNGTGAPIAGGDDPNADQQAAIATRRRQPQPGAIGARRDITGGDARYPEGGAGLGRRGMVAGPSTEPAEIRAGPAADTDRARSQIGPRLGADDGSQLPSALRDIGLAWPDWNGGLAGLAASCAAAGAGRVDDGLPAGMAPGLRNRAIAAYGDAVLPQIAEMIGRTMLNWITP